MDGRKGGKKRRKREGKERGERERERGVTDDRKHSGKTGVE